MSAVATHWARAKYVSRILRKKILSFWIIPTFTCNSRCRTCYLWQDRSGTELKLERIIDTLQSPVLREADLILEGGEFFVYSQYQELLEHLRGRKYLVFTNGILVDRIIEAAKTYQIPEMIISMDGSPERYQDIRGVDNVGNIQRLIEALRDSVRLHVNYTISPMNNRDELEWVKTFASNHGVNFSLNVYHELKYLGTKMAATRVGSLPEDTEEFIAQYDAWFEGRVQLPCHNIKYISAVYPDGSVYLCKNKNDVVLGNVYEQSFQEIWTAARTRQLQQQYEGCNACWLKCQRSLDYYAYRRLGRVLPRSMIDRLLA